MLNRNLAVLLFQAAAAFPAVAATYTWDGAVADWKTAHWLPGGVAWPGEGHDMIINGGTAVVLDADGSYRPQNIVIGSGGTLRIPPGGALFTGADATTRVITVNSGGVLELATWFKADSQSLGRLVPNAGRLVVNGGTIRVTGITGYGRGVTVNAAGGTFEAAADADWLCSNLNDDTAWEYNGNPALVFTGAGTGRLDKVISGGCIVIKRGTGKWTLPRSNSYTGNTTVEAGILALRRATLSDTGTVSIASGATLSLRHTDGDVVGGLILGGTTMPAGTYSRGTHPAFISGSGSLIVGGPAVAGAEPMTWDYGGGGDAGIQATLTDSMNYAVDLYNLHGTFYVNRTANYNSGVPTAQAGFNGPITFGGSRNGRVALHEMGHTFGVGTHGNWGANLSGGVWTGERGARLIQQIDGPGTVINSDGTHFWPYGLNYDNESNGTSVIAHVRMVEAFWQDMGLSNGASTISKIGDVVLPENGNSGALAFTVGDPVVAAGSLVVRAASSNPVLVPASGIVIGGSGASRTVTVTPAAGQTGTAAINVSVSGGRDAVMESFRVTVGNFHWNGGSGVWDTFTPNWHGAATEWPAQGTTNDAYFGAPGGVVTVANGVAVDDLFVQADGYSFIGAPLTFTNTPSISVLAGATALVAAPLAGTVNALSKDGAGTLILTGDTTLSEPINVSAGTLLAESDLTSVGTMTVRNSATLGGGGRLPEVTVESGGRLSPGSSSKARSTLHAEALTFDAGASLMMDLGLAEDDQLLVDGDLVCGGTLTLRVDEVPANGPHTLINYTGTRTGAFTPGPVPAGYGMTMDYSIPGQVRVVVTGGAPSVDLIAARSPWKFHSVVNPVLSADWRKLAYDDSNAAVWATGNAEIGYGDGDEATMISTTAGKPLVAYFRKTFTLSAAEFISARKLFLHLMRDDGAVVYLNDVEIRRDNLPAAPAAIVASTLASGTVGGVDESVFMVSGVDLSLLNAGQNVIAVEVHQDAATSSDISFDLRLQAIQGDADSDDDGLIDEWEMTHFGGLAAQSGGGDADGDGSSNFAEMKARTSPVNRGQSFGITSVQLGAGGQPVVTWPSVSGVLYQLRRSYDLTAWTTQPMVMVGTGAVMSLVDLEPLPAGARTVFYEVVAP
ncbi:MAG TPA: autotransporter-associated beta strand repeat-containing protein [Verrucomicrobiales bacterium]|nr:autotransporter-associated beta strand repeat-containing protein [Verrucomicrobiales bacterium]